MRWGFLLHNDSNNEVFRLRQLQPKIRKFVITIPFKYKKYVYTRVAFMDGTTNKRKTSSKFLKLQLHIIQRMYFIPPKLQMNNLKFWYEHPRFSLIEQAPIKTTTKAESVVFLTRSSILQDLLLLPFVSGSN